MQDHDRRSHVGSPHISGRPARKRWCRPDVARPEPVTRLDLLAELPAAGRKDLAAATLAGNVRGAL